MTATSSENGNVECEEKILIEEGSSHVWSFIQGKDYGCIAIGDEFGDDTFYGFFAGIARGYQDNGIVRRSISALGGPSFDFDMKIINSSIDHINIWWIDRADEDIRFPEYSAFLEDISYGDENISTFSATLNIAAFDGVSPLPEDGSRFECMILDG